MGLTATLLQIAEPFTILWHTALLPLIGMVGLMVCLLAARTAKMPRFALASTAFLQMTLFTLLALLISYNLAAQTGAFWDPSLEAADKLFGFEWPAIRGVADRSSAAVWALGVGYHSLIPQMILVIVALSAMNKRETLKTTVCAAVLAGFVTVLISGLVPAQGNLFDAGNYAHLWPSIASLHEDTILGLRSGDLRALDLSSLMGIVTFPSYHAALAAIFIFSFRAMPRFYLAGAAWAGLTIIATPIVGGHYAIDVVAGIVLAPLSIAAAKALGRWSPRAFAPAISGCWPMTDSRTLTEKMPRSARTTAFCIDSEPLLGSPMFIRRRRSALNRDENERRAADQRLKAQSAQSKLSREMHLQIAEQIERRAKWPERTAARG